VKPEQLASTHETEGTTNQTGGLTMHRDFCNITAYSIECVKRTSIGH
jgi:hypothetical protein